jgi:hypothetical protein
VAVTPVFIPGVAGCVNTPPAEPSPDPANVAGIPESPNATPTTTIVAAAAKPNAAPIRLPLVKNDVC